jgi:hypothetical protein
VLSVFDRDCPNLNQCLIRFRYKQGFAELKFLKEHQSVFIGIIGPARLIVLSVLISVSSAAPMTAFEVSR